MLQATERLLSLLSIALAIAVLAVEDTDTSASCAAGSGRLDPDWTSALQTQVVKIGTETQSEYGLEGALPQVNSSHTEVEAAYLKGSKNVPVGEVAREERQEMLAMDADKDGELSLMEIITKVFQAGNTIPADLDTQLKASFHHADTTGNGRLNDEEFSNFIVHFKGVRSALQKQVLTSLKIDSGPKCDGTWDSDAGCCKNNRPSDCTDNCATGPSPLCRTLMHSCTGKNGDVYECSWWNGFCHGMCSNSYFGLDYDETRYCGYCGA